VLKNPPDDAADVAAALQDAGFEVILLKNAVDPIRRARLNRG